MRCVVYTLVDGKQLVLTIVTILSTKVASERQKLVSSVHTGCSLIDMCMCINQ